MQHHHARDHERQQVVQREEPVQRRIANRVSAQQQLLDRLADTRKRREEAGDHRRAPEGHLAPGQHIAHESGRHHQQVDDAAEDPQQLARRLVGAVIHAAEHVQIDGDEEERRAVGMHVAQQPAVVHVAHDVLDAGEGQPGRGDVVHRQHDAGQDLCDEHHGEDAAEGVGIVQVARHRIGDEGIIHHPRQRHAGIDPFADAGGRRVGAVCFVSAHARAPIRYRCRWSGSCR